MRVKDILISFRFSTDEFSPDMNGVTYTDCAVRNALKNVKQLPIISYDKNGKSTTLGFVCDKYWDGNCFVVNGIIKAGGTCEKVKFNENNEVCQMEITEFGIGE